METNTKPAREPRTMPSRERRTEALTDAPKADALVELAGLLRRAATIAEGLAGSGAPQTAEGIADGGMLTVNAAIALTGLGRTMINKLLTDGKIAKAKVGRRTLIPRSEVTRLLAESLIPANDPT